MNSNRHHGDSCPLTEFLAIFRHDTMSRYSVVLCLPARRRARRKSRTRFYNGMIRFPGESLEFEGLQLSFSPCQPESLCTNAPSDKRRPGVEAWPLPRAGRVVLIPG